MEIDKEFGKKKGEVALDDELNNFVLEGELQSEGDLPRCSNRVGTRSGSGA